MLTGYSLPKTFRGQHIQTCVRWEMASRLGHLQKDVHYCHHCFSWVIGEYWDPHCKQHLATMATKWCGPVIHCHTLMRPGYFPFCMADETLTAPERLVSWARDHQLWATSRSISKAATGPANAPTHSAALQSLKTRPRFDFTWRTNIRFSWARAKNHRSLTYMLIGTLPTIKPPVVSSPRKRKQPPSTEALQWVPSHVSHHAPMGLEEEAMLVILRLPCNCPADRPRERP